MYILIYIYIYMYRRVVVFRRWAPILRGPCFRKFWYEFSTVLLLSGQSGPTLVELAGRCRSCVKYTFSILKLYFFIAVGRFFFSRWAAVGAPGLSAGAGCCWLLLASAGCLWLSEMFWVSCLHFGNPTIRTSHYHIAILLQETDRYISAQRTCCSNGCKRSNRRHTATWHNSKESWKKCS